jgi:hypothetical protein
LLPDVNVEKPLGSDGFRSQRFLILAKNISDVSDVIPVFLPELSRGQQLPGTSRRSHAMASSLCCHMAPIPHSVTEDRPLPRLVRACLALRRPGSRPARGITHRGAL